MKSRIFLCACFIGLAAGCSNTPTASTSFTVNVTADNAAVSPSGSVTVESGKAQAFTVTANSGFTLSAVVGGNCPAGSWSGAVYTTGAIVADCSVAFSANAAPSSFQVAASGDSHETISPSGPQTITAGNRASFTVTANADYTVSSTVGGTCLRAPGRPPSTRRVRSPLIALSPSSPLRMDSW